MLYDDIENLINIIETKPFNNTFYDYFLITENEQPQKPQSGASKLLIGGGLALGAGFLGNELLNNNPELKKELSDNIHSASQVVGNTASKISNAVGNTASKISNAVGTASKALESQSSKLQFKMELGDHTNVNLASSSPEEINAHMSWIKNTVGGKWNSLNEEQKNKLKNAYNQMYGTLKRLNSSGQSTIDYTKEYSPDLFSKISSNDENDAMDRLRRGILPEDKVRTMLASSGQAIQRQISNIQSIPANLKGAIDTMDKTFNPK